MKLNSYPKTTSKFTASPISSVERPRRKVKFADFEDLNDSEIETELKWEEEKSNERIKARKV